MGIKDLFPFINKKHPEVIQYIPLSEFQGKKLAIDGNLLLRKYWSVTVSNYVDTMDLNEHKLDIEGITLTSMSCLISFVNTLVSFKITPIFIFDGGMQKEKKKTCDERKEKVSKYRAKQAELFAKQDADPLTFSEDLQKELRTCWNVITVPSPESKNKIQNMLRSLGIPVLISKTDGEKLCCSLYIEDRVDAVFADDSDCIPFGALDLFTAIEKLEDGNKAFKSVQVIQLLETLDITFEQLVDACIISGCDYSKGLKGFGMIKAISQIKESGTIEAITKEDIDQNICRSIFRYTPSSELILEETVLEMSDIDEEFVAPKELNYQIGLFRKLVN